MLALPVKHHSFTLIELLIVIAIIAILALIAIPNFLEAQTRSKVARATTDMRTIAIAIEAYCIDYATYPPDGNGPPYTGLIVLTSPVAYCTSVFKDIFNNCVLDGRNGNRIITPGNVVLCYELGTGNPAGSNISFPASVWAVASYGPDLDDDTHDIGVFPFTKVACPYDPTNGTISQGDIYRLSYKHPNFDSDANPIVY